MIYLLLFIMLAVPVAILIGLVHAFNNLRLRNFLLLVIFLVSTPYLLFKTAERRHRLSFVPYALNVTSITYSNEEAWGFGPGGNEAGIITYPLSEEISNEIAGKGLGFFRTTPSDRTPQSASWRGRYINWRQTPILVDKYWKPRKESLKLDIYDYICMYGFCIDIDPDIVKKANAVVNSPGSYYAYGRIGLIIVSPKIRQVIYMYNG